MKKPEFPKPQLIREDFLPEQDHMSNYRIKKETKFGRTRYYPQKKFLFWWLDIFNWEPYHDGSFLTFELAQEKLCDYISETTVEYLDFDCSKCMDSSKTVP